MSYRRISHISPSKTPPNFWVDTIYGSTTKITRILKIQKNVEKNQNSKYTLYNIFIMYWDKLELLCETNYARASVSPSKRKVTKMV